jgi:hypothetical protein
MIALGDIAIPAVSYDTVNIAFRRDAGITAASVGTDNGSLLDLFKNAHLQLFRFNAVDQPGPDLAVSAQDARYCLLAVSLTP